jgi:branched-chain amino acid transport system permease protein
MQSNSIVKKQNTWLEYIIRRGLLGKAFILVLGLVVTWKLVVSLIENPTVFLSQVYNGLQLGFVYALIALGYTMVYGIVRLINFAHGDVFMVGAFTSYYAIARFGLNNWLANLIPGVPGWLSIGIGTITVMVVSMFVCAVLAFTIERVAYKPLRNAPRISALITAIGVSFFLEYFAQLPFVYGPNFVTYQRPFPVKTWTVGNIDIQISNIAIIIVIVSFVLLMGLQYIVRRTRLGKAMRATAYDKPTSRLMGININSTISLTFAIGAALAGAGGVLFATSYNQVYFAMGIIPGLKAFVAAVLGGIGSIPGAFIGALIMGQVEVLSSAYISTPMRDAVAFSLLIIVLLIRPTGIFGEPTMEKA